LAYPAFVLVVLHTFTTSAEVKALGLVGVAVVGIAGAVLLMFILRLIPGTALVSARIAPEES
jgi:cell division protein FtsN